VLIYSSDKLKANRASSRFLLSLLIRPKPKGAGINSIHMLQKLKDPNVVTNTFREKHKAVV